MNNTQTLISTSQTKIYIYWNKSHNKRWKKMLRDRERKEETQTTRWLLRWSWHRVHCSRPLLGLCKLYPLRGKICGGWTTENPPLKSPSAVVCFCRDCSTCLSDPFQRPRVFLFIASSLSSQCSFLCLWSCFPLWFHHNHSCPNLSIHCCSLLHLSPLLLCLYISLPPPFPPLFSSPQLCYFLLCMEDTFSLRLLGEWWLHQWGGLVNRYLLFATAGSVRADADFPLGWTHRLGVPTKELSRCAQAASRAGRHPHRHAASGCLAGVLVYVCLVWWWVSHCAAVTVAPPSPAHTSRPPQTQARPCGLLVAIVTRPDRVWIQVHSEELTIYMKDHRLTLLLLQRKCFCYSSKVNNSLGAKLQIFFIDFEFPFLKCLCSYCNLIIISYLLLNPCIFVCITSNCYWPNFPSRINKILWFWFWFLVWEYRLG